VAEVETLGGNAQGALKSFVERIERLEEDKAGVASDIKDVYAELKGQGFDGKTVRALIRLMKQDKAKRQEAQAMLDLYSHALGLDLV
jgi:uncharacterized protein (UPF0335 family)